MLLYLHSVNPNQVGGGGQMAHRVLEILYLWSKSRIDLKPGCKFKFVRCLAT